MHSLRPRTTVCIVFSVYGHGQRVVGYISRQEESIQREVLLVEEQVG